MGRAPVSTPEEASNFVRKTIDYEATDGFVLRKVLSLQFTGAYNRMTMTVMAAQRSFEVLGGANVYIGELLKLGQLMVSLKGQFRETDSGGDKIRMTRLLAQGTLAF